MERDKKLHELFDGELGSDESRVLLSTLSAEDRGKLTTLSDVGTLVRVHVQDVPMPDSDRMFAAIEARLSEVAESREVPTKKLRAMDGGAGKASSRTDLKNGKSSTWLVGGAFALAAAVTLAVVARPGEMVQPSAARDPLDRGRSMLASPSGSAVETIDFGVNSGTVFQVEGEEGQPLAVVWIDEGL